MTDVTASLHLSKGVFQTNRQLLRIVRDWLIERFAEGIPRMELRIKGLIERSILESSEVESLRSGELKFLFGLTNPEGDILQIIRLALNTIKVKVSRPVVRGRFGIGGEIRVFGIDSDAGWVLDSEVASFISEGGFKVEWLRALLLEGVAVHRNYEFVPSSTIGKPVGRTGGGIMSKVSLGGWSVPAVHSGTEDSNFISRSIDHVMPRIQSAMLEDVFGKKELNSFVV